MKKTPIAAGVLSFVFAASVFAAGETKPPMESAPDFDQKKTEVLKRIDEQMRHLQEAKTCIKEAKNQDEMKACRQKQIAERKKLREERRKKQVR